MARSLTAPPTPITLGQVWLFAGTEYEVSELTTWAGDRASIAYDDVNDDQVIPAKWMRRPVPVPSARNARLL